MITGPYLFEKEFKERIRIEIEMVSQWILQSAMNECPRRQQEYFHKEADNVKNKLLGHAMSVVLCIK
jgi:hypothetical protein